MSLLLASRQVTDTPHPKPHASIASLSVKPIGTNHQRTDELQVKGLIGEVTESVVTKWNRKNNATNKG